MSEPSFIWGSFDWIAAVLGLMAVAAAALSWSYARAKAKASAKVPAALLKTIGFSALAISLLEPLLTGLRPRPGANAFVIMADNSQSMLIRNGSGAQSRGQWLRGLVEGESPWKTRLEQDFDVRSYAFDTSLRAVDSFHVLTFDGTGSSLVTSLGSLQRRFRGLPLAGVLLFTDGNRTDTGELDFSALPPIYPVAPPSGGDLKDVAVSNVSVTQTNFESAPVVIRADVSAVGFRGETIVTTLIDGTNKERERQKQTCTGDGVPLHFRFQFRPEHKGVSFYRVQSFAASDEGKSAGSGDAGAPSEQTGANNSRLVVVDQGSGPNRVLYVCGRPNWEFKFLRRAIDEDEQVQLVSLVRIARRQPKFDFRDMHNQGTSPLFTGFDHPDPDAAERADQPVLVRLGTLDEVELRDGFPKTAAELYRYHGVVLDDVEAGFFSPDQLALLRNFVSQRGAGLLMLGGPDSFAEGQYDRTPVGEVLPVYVGRSVPAQEEQQHRLELTREGWLAPWVRTRKTEDEERQRLAEMATFRTLSRVGNIKPGAVVLSEARDPAGAGAPALVAQQFGKGHSAALLVGDLWRWGMRRHESAESDFERFWRQAIRWLVSDVPSRVDIEVRPKTDAANPSVSILVHLRDAEYRPLDNAKVRLRISRPGGDDLELDAEPDGQEAGTYAATYVPRVPGAYKVVAHSAAPDGSALDERETGWAAQPAVDEFSRLEPDSEFLKTIAARTHGELVDAGRLGSFVSSLSARSAPITEPWTYPLWHHPLYFLIALACLTAEWGLRRINGLA
jgi:uncharacterized membrane protein